MKENKLKLCVSTSKIRCPKCNYAVEKIGGYYVCIRHYCEYKSKTNPMKDHIKQKINTGVCLIIGMTMALPFLFVMLGAYTTLVLYIGMLGGIVGCAGCVITFK